jgi:glutamate-1-semialdehyde aminotransferase
MGIAVHLMGDGPMGFPLFTDEPVSNYRGYLRADRAKERRFSLAMLRRGCFVNPGTRSSISLAHSDADVARTLTAARAAFGEAESPEKSTR